MAAVGAAAPARCRLCLSLCVNEQHEMWSALSRVAANGGPPAAHRGAVGCSYGRGFLGLSTDFRGQDPLRALQTAGLNGVNTLPLALALVVQQHVERVLHRSRGRDRAGVDEEDLVGVRIVLSRCAMITFVVEAGSFGESARAAVRSRYRRWPWPRRGSGSRDRAAPRA